jgi:hypothetical protein
MTKSTGLLLATGMAALALFSTTVDAALIRGPYLQLGTPTSIVVRWRTDVAEDSRVRWGTIQGSLTDTKDDATSTTEHSVTIDGLTPQTTYFYEVGSTSTALAGDDLDHFFKTSPAKGDAAPTRIWAIGDSGYPEPGMAGGFIQNGDAVRDAYTAFNGGVASADVFLLLGDNAYTFATDAEYQTDLFEQYPAFLRTTPAWACIGNHEGFVANSITQAGDYYSVFTLPASGEAGGVPSGTESYYSFDHGNIHFVVLDSEDSIEDPAATETMQDWLEADLASTDADWLIAFWHRPPYSKGFFHDSDVEVNEILMRENMNPILEDYGVDIVLSGHSHHYERSLFIDGHYGLSTEFGPQHIVDGGSGDPMIDNAYEKSGKGMVPHAGAVYVVAGSASEVRTGLGVHPVMQVSLESLGSFVLDIDGETATGTFLDETGTVQDTFEINKGVACPPTPSIGCTAAAKSKIVVKDNTKKDKGDKLIWKAKGMNVDPADLGNPLVDADLDICLYDASGKLFAASLGSGSPPWKSLKSGALYKDKGAEEAGIKVAKAKTSTAGKGLILAKAKGVHLFTPTIPVSLPVTAQAKNDETGACWESVFTSGDVRKNQDGKFVAAAK